MSAQPNLKKALMHPAALLTAAGILAVALVWLFVFFMPQSKKLTSLQTERTSLNATIARDNARVQQLRSESKHLGQINTMYASLRGYVPQTEDLYTYIHTISGAAKAAGVSITSLTPGTLTPLSGTSYSAIPISANVKGGYAQLVSFLHGVYALPRLTDINGLTLNTGGTSSSTLSATLQLAIFTSQKPASSSSSTPTTSSGL